MTRTDVSPKLVPPSSIVGARHLAQWRNLVKSGVVFCELSASSLIPVGDDRSWEDLLFGVLDSYSKENNCIAVVVGPGDIDLTVNSLNKCEFDKFVSILSRWRDVSNGCVVFVFWDFLCLQIVDRLAGKNIITTSCGSVSKREYRHPVWNLDEAINAMPQDASLNLLPLLNMPMHEISRIFITPDFSPSQIGYIFLDNVLCKNKTLLQAYDDAVSSVEGVFFEAAARINGIFKKPVVLTGRSVWLSTLSQYMGMSGTIRLAHQGLVIAPLDKVIGRPTLEEMSRFLSEKEAEIVIFDHKNCTKEEVFKICGFFDVGDEWVEISWEGLVNEAVVGNDLVSKVPVSILQYGNVDGDIDVDEHGVGAAPSLSGIAYVFELIEKSKKSPAPRFKLFNDVLISGGGVAYLLGGGHSILKYVTGELKPSKKSIKNFCKNIKSRELVARKKIYPMRMSFSRINSP